MLENEARFAKRKESEHLLQKQVSLNMGVKDTPFLMAKLSEILLDQWGNGGSIAIVLVYRGFSPESFEKFVFGSKSSSPVVVFEDEVCF